MFNQDYRLSRIVSMVLVTLLTIPIGYYLLSGFFDFEVDGSFGYRSISKVLSTELWRLLSNTFIYSFITAIGQILLGICSLKIVYDVKNTRILKYSLVLLFLVPYLIPTACSTLLWELTLRTQGFANWGIFTNKMDQRFYHLILLSIWQYSPFVFFFLYAGFQRINNEELISSSLDGYSSNESFWQIVIPQLKNSIRTLFLLRFVLMSSKLDTAFLFLRTKSRDDKWTTLPIRIFDANESTAPIFESSSIGYVLVLILFVTLSFALFYIGFKTISITRHTKEICQNIINSRIGRLTELAIKTLGLSFALIPTLLLILSVFIESEIMTRGLNFYLVSSMSFASFAENLDFSKINSNLDFLYYSGSLAIISAIIGFGVALIVTYDMQVEEMIRINTKSYTWSFLIAYIVPPVILAVSIAILYPMVTYLGAEFSLYLAHILFTTPFGVIASQSYVRISGIKNILDSSRIDGFSHYGTMINTFIPIVWPGLMTIVIFIFVVSWNDISFALLIGAGEFTTYPILMSEFMTVNNSAELGAFLGLSLLISILLLIILLLTLNRSQSIMSRIDK